MRTRSQILVSGTFTGTGQSASFVLGPVSGAAFSGRANLWLSGGVGTVKVQASYDSGSTWFDVGRDGAGEFTLAAGQAFTDFVDEVEFGITFRINCTAYTSGTITYRVSQ